MPKKVRELEAALKKAGFTNRGGKGHRKSSKQSKASANEMARVYPAVIEWSDEDACFVARVPALPGCMSHGETMAKAAANILDAAEGWVQSALEDGDRLPPPPTGMSGKLLVRIPKGLHENIARRAELDGVSINQWVVAALAHADAGR
jgi:antitoxin HicB